MAKSAWFTPDLFRFLDELAKHNDRDWFHAHKERYEKSVRDPFLRLVADLQPRLKKIAPAFVADPRPVGGSMMRIYRDTRFWHPEPAALARIRQAIAADHPFIEDLKRKDFATTAPLDERRIASASFLDDLVDGWIASTPFMKFVTRAVGLTF